MLENAKSSYYKWLWANLFAVNFAFTTMLENKSHLLPDFPPLKGHNLYFGSGSFQVKQKTWLYKDYQVQIKFQ